MAPLAVPLCACLLGLLVGSQPGAAWLLPGLVVALLAPSLRTAALALAFGLLSAASLAGEKHVLDAVRHAGLHRLHVRCTEAGLPHRRRQALVCEVLAVGTTPCGAGRRTLAVDLALSRYGGPLAISPGDELAIDVWLPARPSHSGIPRVKVHDPRRWERREVGAGPHAVLHEARRALANRLAQALARRPAELARAVLLGDRAALRYDVVRSFRETGQSHLLAVSGLHVGCVAALLVLAVSWLPLGPRVRAGIVLPMVLLYVPLTGGSPSAARAGTAAALYLVARIVGRTPTAIGLLTTTAFCLLLVEPMVSGSLSAHLSFGAVMGILLLRKPLERMLVRPPPLVLPGYVEAPKARVRKALAISLAACLGTAPIGASAFQTIVPEGALLAVLFVPLLAVFLGLVLATLVVHGLPVVGDAAVFLANLAGEGLRVGIAHAENWGLGTVPVAAPLGLLCGQVALLALLARTRTAQGARRVFGAIVGLWLVSALAAPTNGDPWRDGSRVPHAMLAAMPPAFVPLAALPTAPSPTTMWVVAALGAAFALVSVRPLRWLDAGGAASAFVLAVAGMAVFGHAALAALLAPFLVATVLGKLPGWERSSARNWRQVAANGFPSALGLGVAALGSPAWGAALFLGGLANLGADTSATELGTRYGGTPRSLWTLRPVARGASGGVSGMGLLATVLGSLLAPVAWWAFAPAGNGGWVPAIAAAGIAGSLIDSALGARFQFRGRMPDGSTTEATSWQGTKLERASGFRFLDNDAVNLASGLAAALLALGFVSALGLV